MKDKLLIEENLNKYGLVYNDILQKEKGIKVKRINDYFLYRYNQLDNNCNFSDEITQECRSIIFKYNSQDIVEPRNTEQKEHNKAKFTRVCVPFYKFFNYNEPISNDLYNKMKDKNLYAYEKIDGAMIMLWYDEYWHISTSGNINAADAPISNPNSIFKNYLEMFEYCAKEQNLDYDKLDKNCTYIFEMIGKYIRIVVPYNIIGKIYHIGTRNNITLEENFNEIGIEQPNVFQTKGMYEIMKYIDNLTIDDEHFEGLVVRDDNYNRLKVKPDIYFHLSFLNNNGDITPKRIINMIMNGDDEEFISYFKDYIEDVNYWKTKMLNLTNSFKQNIIEILKKENIYKEFNNRELFENTKNNPLQSLIISAVKDINQGILTEDVVNEYVVNKINFLYSNRRKFYISLLEKF